MTPSLRDRRGYSLAELLIAMVVGVLVLSSAMSLAVSTFRSMAGLTLRDGIDRNARYLGMVLQRDLTETGIDIESQANFGTLAVWADTISILSVPYRGDSAAPVYRLLLTIDPNGVCNANDCVYIQATSLPQIVAGDLVRIQLQTTRRLARISSVQAVTGGYRLNYVAAQNMLIHHPAGTTGWTISNGSAPNVLVQELAPVMYYRAGTQLMRAASLNASGRPVGEVVAEGVQTFDASLIFTDGEELTQANGADGDGTNDYNQIAGIRVRAMMRSERADPRVNGGALLTREYEWFVAPRNLIYERNRVGS
jgi:prepilin-type N-terminal cleavage/methylation domain-containing protein